MITTNLFSQQTEKSIFKILGNSLPFNGMDRILSFALTFSQSSEYYITE